MAGRFFLVGRRRGTVFAGDDGVFPFATISGRMQIRLMHVKKDFGSAG